MASAKSDLGILGLGVMGLNLALNIADHGFTVAGYDLDPSRASALAAAVDGGRATGAADIPAFLAGLRAPRAVILLVPAGPPVDAALRSLLPYLEPGDLVVDGGNSHFKDTDLRGRMLAERGVAFIGLGVSGGEEGARQGPSLMPGGPAEAYPRLQPVLEAIAARANGEPCVAYLGPGSAGHYVKMVHNGIEYGLMQLIAETYDQMKRGLGLSDDELSQVYAAWNEGELNSYLLEISADIFRQTDPKTGERLIGVILDAARQKGTGMWASQDAMALGVPIPTIDAAVSARNLSAHKAERVDAAQLLEGTGHGIPGDRNARLAELRAALYAGMLTTFSQGMALLRAASQAYGYGLDLETVAQVWSGGCIIRAALLEQLRAAYRAKPGLPNSLQDPNISQAVLNRLGALRSVVTAAAGAGLPAPGFMSALAYLDGYRSAWLPANLIQAQRDYFGAHTYERIDARGVFHTDWTTD